MFNKMKNILTNSFFMKGCFFVCLASSIPFAHANRSGLGYKSIIKNYFSGRKSNTRIFYGAPRSLSLFAGTSINGENKDSKQRIFSSRVLGFNQRIKEFSTLGDLNLKVEWSSIKLEERATEIRITPHFSLPDIRSGFPIYIGTGLGIGFFPSYIFEKAKFFSASSDMYVGLRLLDIYKNFGFLTELNLKMRFPFQEMKLYTELVLSLGLVFSF